ncbi:MAG: sigma-70 family RNA polymerase sigma factor [Firmicutes bacterium]|nr:sigma-70 family RNA polymerase sigma factor [Bacillota bacterium]
MTEYQLEKIINKYSRLLWSVATRILEGIGNEQDAEECVADVFIELWNEPEKFDENRGTLKSWLCMRTRSKAIDRFRRLASRLTDELSPDLTSDKLGPEEELIRRERAKDLRDKLDRLDEESKEIMIRRFVLEQKPSFIASAMELPLRRVENVIFRTKQKLRDELGGNYE